MRRSKALTSLNSTSVALKSLAVNTRHHVLLLLKNDLMCWECIEKKVYGGSGGLVTTIEEKSEGENRRKKCDLHPERELF